jgi:hypothetical protein
MASEPDQRQAPEQRALDAVTVCRVAEGEVLPIEATVRDMSRTAIGLKVSEPLEPGSLLRVTLPAAESRHIVVLACVSHATPQPGGWLVEALFSAELAAEDLPINHEGRSTAAERRSAPRSAARGRARFREVPDPSIRPPLFADILNVSTAGIGLLLPLRLEPGTMLELELLRDGDVALLTILACVVYLRSDGEGWVAGCSLIHELSDTICGQLI